MFGGRPGGQDAAPDLVKAFSQASGAHLQQLPALQQQHHQQQQLLLHQGPPASAPTDSPLVRPWPRLGTGAFLSAGGNADGGGSASLSRRLSSGNGGSGVDAPVFEPLHLQAVARQQLQQAQHAQHAAQQQQQQLQQLGFSAQEAAARRQLEALAAQQGLGAAGRDFRRSGGAAAAAGAPAEQPQTTWLQSALLLQQQELLQQQQAMHQQQQQQQALQPQQQQAQLQHGPGDGGQRPQPRRQPLRRELPPADDGGRLESPQQRRQARSPGGSAIRPLARRMQTVVVPPCFCDADTPPGLSGRCC